MLILAGDTRESFPGSLWNTWISLFENNCQRRHRQTKTYIRSPHLLREGLFMTRIAQTPGRRDVTLGRSRPRESYCCPPCALHHTVNVASQGAESGYERPPATLTAPPYLTAIESWLSGHRLPAQLIPPLTPRSKIGTCLGFVGATPQTTVSLTVDGRLISAARYGH